MGHRVTAVAVQVAAGRRVHMLDKGDIIPQGVDSATLDRLVAKGFIESFEDGATEGDETPAVELPSKSWNHERIDEWAAEQDPPVVFTNADESKALTKEQKLEQIAAELTKRSEQQQ